MIWTFLIIYWVLLGAMTASALFFKSYQNHQILGVTFSKVHASTIEVQKIQKSYRTACTIQLLAFFAVSLLMLWKPVKPYADFYMLFLTLVLLIMIGVLIKIYQEKLKMLKETNHWIYPKSPTVLIDTEAATEKGKSAVPIFWSWLFVVLSLLPTFYLVLNPEVQKLYPVFFSLIGPACQLLMVLMYRQSLNHHTPVLSEDSEINKALARTEERINSMASTLTGLVMLLFWILFSAFVLYSSDKFVSIYIVVFMVISLMAITYWQRKKIHHAERYFFENTQNTFSDDDSNEIYEQGSVWKWGFYNNPNDPRLFVPKRVAGLGWTINIAKRKGKAVMIGTFLFIIGILGLLFVSSLTDYKIEENNSQITISSVIYHSTFDVDDIISVEMIAELPDSNRTNGYGGISKSYGHFQVDNYGSCMFYLYNDINEYIVIHLKGDGPQYIFMNDETNQETDELYEYFQTLSK